MGAVNISWIAVLPCCLMPVIGIVGTWVLYRTGRHSASPPATLRSRWEGLSQDQAFGGDNGKNSDRDRDRED